MNLRLGNVLRSGIAFATFIMLLGVCGAGAQDAERNIRFSAVNVYVDAGQTPLAVYQVDLRASSGDVKFVGVEGGDHAAFQKPPHYDPKAMQGNRVIIADFSTRPESELPSGRVRVARIHVQISGNDRPTFNARLIAAAGPSRQAIKASVSVELLNP